MKAKRLRKFKLYPYYEAWEGPLLKPTLTVRKDRDLGMDKQSFTKTELRHMQVVFSILQYWQRTEALCMGKE